MTHTFLARTTMAFSMPVTLPLSITDQRYVQGFCVEGA